MLVWRIVVGAAIIGGLAGLCWLDYRATTPGVWLLPVVLVIALLAAGEMCALAPPPRSRVDGWIVCLGTVWVVALGGAPALWWSDARTCAAGCMGWPALGVAAGALVALAYEMGRYPEPGRGRANLAYSVFAMVYVGLLLSFLVQIRFVDGGSRGMVALVSLVVTVKMGDIGAYTVGRLVGRHKMAPRLSPGKTWEGCAGSMLFTCVGAWLTLGPLSTGFGLSPLPVTEWLLYAVVVGGAGVLGDLAESLLKRDAGVKDSSHWLPGFGGVLDMLDSLLLAAPVAHLFWCFRAAAPS